MEIGIPTANDKICGEWSYSFQTGLPTDKSSAAGVIVARGQNELCVLVNASKTKPCAESFKNYIEAKLAKKKSLTRKKNSANGAKIKVTTRNSAHMEMGQWVMGHCQ